MAEIFKTREGETTTDEAEKLAKTGRFSSQWGSLMVNPKVVKFQDLDEDEVIVLLGRRHLITNIGWLFVACIAFCVPIFWNQFPLLSVLNTNVYFSLVVFWYLGLTFYVLLKLVMWFYNLYIVTNERLISVDFLGLLSKSINVTHLSKIQDVSFSQRGIMSSFFNFGDVIVETASEQRTADVADGEKSTFTFEMVGNPNEVVRVISDLVEKESETNRR